MENTREYISEDAFTETSCDQQETIVVFRTSKEDGSVVALFPGMSHETGDTSEHGTVLCYEQSIGQHGSADYAHVIAATRPATEEEYEDLAAELTDRGYRLRIVKKKPLTL